MADKYVDVSLTTGANDGTSQADAWHSLVEVFNNTIASGSITAGDTIYVRTADSGGDLEEEFTANINCATPASVSAQTSFVFDNGVKWAEAGVFTLFTSTNLSFITKGYVNFYADGINRRFNIQTRYTTVNNGAFFTLFKYASAYYEGLRLTSQTAGVRCGMSHASDSGTNFVTFRNLLYAITPRNDYYAYAIRLSGYIASSLNFIDCEFDFSNTTYTTSDWALIFIGNGIRARIEFNGGKVTGGWQNLKFFVPATTDNNVNCIFRGFDFGAVIPDMSDTVIAKYGQPTSWTILDSPNSLDYMHRRGGVLTEYKATNYQPTLNATLPDGSNTPWSLMVYALDNSVAVPTSLPPIEKIYDQATGIKTLKVELLMNTNLDADTMAGVFWAEFSYYDDTLGRFVTQSTKNDGGAIPTSEVNWSTLTYGGILYSRRKFSITTSGSIRSGTRVICNIYCAFTRTLTTDFMFIDPDMSIL